MTSGDYTTTGGGLKLKGGIEKPKRKKKRVSKPDLSAAVRKTDLFAAPRADAEAKSDENQPEGPDPESSAARDEPEAALQSAVAEGDEPSENREMPREAYIKTEAELRHEERRRRQFHERLKRDGVKTHKERVEVLNTYLSRLSEHHDMPRIGPG